MTRLSTLADPRELAEALAGSKLGNYWKYRVGDRLLARPLASAPTDSMSACCLTDAVPDPADDKGHLTSGVGP